MKTAVPSAAKDAQNPASSSHRTLPGPHSGRLAQLAAIMNQSLQVHAQLKLSDEIQNGESVQRQMALAAEINQAPVAQPRLREENEPAQREEAPSPNHTGLPDQLKAGVENLSGISLDDVKVHYNSAKPAQLNALAYAQGTDIHVAPGQEQHLPHEAWHIVQQAQGRVKPTMQMKAGTPVNGDPHLEHEADVMGARALRLTRLEPATVPVQSNSAACPESGIAQRQEKEDAPKTVSSAGAELEKTITALRELLESSGESEEASKLEGYIAELEEIAKSNDPGLEDLALEALEEEAKARAGSSLGKLVGGKTSNSSAGEPEVVQGFFLYDWLVWAASWAYNNPVPVVITILGAAFLKIKLERDRRRELNDDVEAALQGVADKDLQAQLRHTWELLKATGGKASFVDTAKSKGGYEKGKLLLNIARKNQRDSGDTAIAKRGIVIHELTHVAEVVANTKGLTDIPRDLSKIMETDVRGLADIVNDELFPGLDHERKIFEAVAFRSSKGIVNMYDYIDERLKYAFQYLAEEGNKQRNFEFPTVLNEIIYVIDQKASETQDNTLKRTELYKQLIKLQKTTRQSRKLRGGKQD